MNSMPHNIQPDNSRSLSDKIWITRKARINAEERLKHWDAMVKLALVMYALASVSIGIGSIVLDIDPRAQWVGIALAIVLLPISTLMSAQRFAERSTLMRICYTQLSRLCHRARETNGENFGEIEDAYCMILSLSENHRRIDYLCYSILSTNEKLNRKEWGRIRNLPLYCQHNPNYSGIRNPCSDCVPVFKCVI